MYPNYTHDEEVNFVRKLAQSSYGKPLSRVAARLGDPSGLYGSLGGAGEASTGFLWIIIDTVTL